MGQPSSFKRRGCAKKRSSQRNGTRNYTTAQCSHQSYEFPRAFFSPDIHAPKGNQSEICNPKAMRHHLQGTVSKATLATTPLLETSFLPTPICQLKQSSYSPIQVHTLSSHFSMPVCLFSKSSLRLANGPPRSPENRDNIVCEPSNQFVKTKVSTANNDMTQRQQRTSPPKIHMIQTIPQIRKIQSMTQFFPHTI